MNVVEPPCVLLLFRAILTLKALPDPDLPYFQIGSAWPDYARRYLDAYNPDEEAEAPWRPTPHDVQEYLSVLGWARDLRPLQWDIMVLRARDYSLGLIADVLRHRIEHILRNHARAVRLVSLRAHSNAIDNLERKGPYSRHHQCA